MGGERDRTRHSRLRGQKGPGNTHRKAAHPPSLSSFKLCFHATLALLPRPLQTEISRKAQQGELGPCSQPDADP